MMPPAKLLNLTVSPLLRLHVEPTAERTKLEPFATILLSVLPIILQCESPLMALNGQASFAGFCPLSDHNGQTWILARDGLSAYDPKRTCRTAYFEGAASPRNKLMRFVLVN
jgi:hypothetical protein